MRAPEARLWAAAILPGDSDITALAADRPGGRLAFTLEGERVGAIDPASGRVTHVLERHTAL